MSYQATQEKVKNLKRMGLTGQGLKKGSRIIPLLLLTIVVLIFFGRLKDKEFDALQQMMLTEIKKTNITGTTPGPVRWRSSVCPRGFQTAAWLLRPTLRRSHRAGAASARRWFAQPWQVHALTPVTPTV